MKYKLLLLPILAFLFCLPARGQDVALKTNLVSDAFLNPNLGVEFGLAPKWSLDVSGQFNLWTVDDRKWRHWLVQPEVRYWFCQRFSGHFVGLHALGGEYNWGNLNLDFKFLGTDFSMLKDSRAEGWYVGAGVAYGYAWILNRRWTIEAEIGVGWVYTRYDRYPCAVCGTKLDDNKPHNYFGPTKAAVNLVYVF
ncbi:MAG: DUF3575 domain-containing protein [Bacteroides sp.]|nr:DUF3575 domain-containing protein [Bacteroides sp.]